jgi:hypothetical protein
MSLWRLNFQTLAVALLHGHLKKVAVMLKVYRVTELYGKQMKNRPFQRGCLAPLFA